MHADTVKSNRPFESPARMLQIKCSQNVKMGLQMRLYRGLSRPYRSEQVNVAKNGTDFTDCPLAALKYAKGANGQIIVLDLSDEQTAVKVTPVEWGEGQPARYIIWNQFDVSITQIVSAKILRKAMLASGMRKLHDADKAMILRNLVDAQTKKLIPTSSFAPPMTEDGDEFFPNGIFVFNITKLLAFIKASPDAFPVELAEIKGLKPFHSGNLDEATVLKADVTNPIILGEIAPGLFNVIDGNHRLEKAHRDGLEKIPLYRVFARQHVNFLRSTDSYTKYCEYWNSKVEASVY